MSYAIKQSMKEEIQNYIQNGETFDDIREKSGEFIDGYLPVYYNEIVREWQEMPASYDDRGRAELGAREDFTIHHLMSLDLFLYYTDIFNQAIDEMEEGE